MAGSRNPARNFSLIKNPGTDRDLNFWFFMQTLKKLNPLLLLIIIAVIAIAVVVKKNQVSPLDITLTNKQNQEVTLKNYLNKKPLVIMFWASWCGYCQREVSVLNQLFVQHPEIQLLGIQVDEGIPNDTFKTAQYTVLGGGDGGANIMHQFGNLSGSIPYIVFLDERGTPLASHAGAISLAELDQKLTDLHKK